MMKNLSETIVLTHEGWKNSLSHIATDTAHQLKLDVSAEKNYALLNFSSRDAMYDFARALLHQAVFDDGDSIEFLPQSYDGVKQECINGVRMAKGSARLFINHPN